MIEYFAKNQLKIKFLHNCYERCLNNLFLIERLVKEYK